MGEKRSLVDCRDTGAERRNHARERTHIEVEVWKDFRRAKGIMEYLSFGGAFVSIHNPFLTDSLVRIRFDIPGQYLAFEGQAKVVWVQKDRAMGIEFVDLDSSERTKLETILVH
ncbi:MAG: PilZ domain-containing protein [Terriglobia bacterium]